MERIIVELSDFERNFKSNPTYKTIFDLQLEFDRLVELYNQTFLKHGMHSKTQIVLDHIIVLKMKYELS